VHAGIGDPIDRIRASGEGLLGKADEHCGRYGRPEQPAGLWCGGAEGAAEYGEPQRPRDTRPLDQHELPATHVPQRQWFHVDPTVNIQSQQCHVQLL
jgi:hypothetical protein